MDPAKFTWTQPIPAANFGNLYQHNPTQPFTSPNITPYPKLTWVPHNTTWPPFVKILTFLITLIPIWPHVTMLKQPWHAQKLEVKIYISGVMNEWNDGGTSWEDCCIWKTGRNKFQLPETLNVCFLKTLNQQICFPLKLLFSITMVEVTSVMHDLSNMIRLGICL